MKSTTFILLTTLLALTVLLPIAVPVSAPSTLLNPKGIPKYVNQLTGPPPIYIPTIMRNGDGVPIKLAYTVYMNNFTQRILPTTYANGTSTGFAMTPVWGYGGLARDGLTGKPLGFVQNSPGPTFEAIKGVATEVTWVNNITEPHMFAVDPTLHWANPNEIPMPGTPDAPTAPFPTFPPGFDGTQQNPTGFFYNAQSPVPLIPHLHGGEVQSTSDGHPEAWFTVDGKQGPGYNTLYDAGDNTAVFYYPNKQPPTTLWYHDHALGITRINVMSGLAGFYLLRDVKDTVGSRLPKNQFEMPIVIQDRTFNDDGTFYFHTEGNEPTVHPYWNPEFFGDTIMVNGLVWPNMDVSRGHYRLRILDGSNARFYTLRFQVKEGEDDMGNPDSYGELIKFTQIGSDGGYLQAPVYDLEELTIAPGERVDILVDFSGLAPGTKVILRNTAYTPFKGGSKAGDAPDPDTVGQIMQFTVTKKGGPRPIKLPTTLNPTLPAGEWPTLTPPQANYNRTLVLVEVMSEAGEPVMILLNGQEWAADISERPVLGSAEEWIIVNPTEDTHPIHLHLVQFQLVYRQNLTDPAGYFDAWNQSQGVEGPPFPDDHEVLPLEVTPWLEGPPINATAYEMGWKDTIQAHPGQITVIRIRFTPIDGSIYDAETLYPFDATAGPGYVWHCHILDHEDNEMMRPYVVVAPEDEE
ncbi:multicopper oxidase domain-containing protein [Candidatus Bathyarchaeota archaeon]|nr:multicopper oxidase domain-containing protein [Candidatus Bathyarchaeota archaeon]